MNKIFREQTLMEKIAIRLGIGTPKENDIFVIVQTAPARNLSKEANKMSENELNKDVQYAQDNVTRNNSKLQAVLVAMNNTDDKKSDVYKALVDKEFGLRCIIKSYSDDLLVAMAIYKSQDSEIGRVKTEMVERLEKDIASVNEDITRYQNKVSDAEAVMATLKGDKTKKATIKYMAKQISTYKMMEEHSREELKAVQDILNEQ